MRLITKKMDNNSTERKYPKEPNDGDDFTENNEDGGLFKV